MYFKAALSVLLALAAPASAKKFEGRDSALKRSFPSAERFEKKTAYLSEEQVSRAETVARARVADRVWSYHVAIGTSGVLGYAYVDRVTVRTMPAVIFAAIDPDGTSRSVRILTFEEPEDYLPRERWLGLFEGHGLSDRLRVHGIIKNVAGSTLTSRSVTASLRRILAVHGLLHPRGDR